MGKAQAAYKDGYEKGQADTMAGNLEEALVGLFRDDPEGFFAVGYHDGAAGDTYDPPSGEEEKTPEE